MALNITTVKATPGKAPPQPPKGRPEVKILDPGFKIESRATGEYEVLKMLGRGGYGVVYKVRHVSSNEEYAMKTESSAAKMQSLKMEVRVLKALEQVKGRHFCKIVARGRQTELDVNFVVMTLVGQSLTSLRKEFGTRDGAMFRGSTALRLAVQTLEAVEDLHKAGYLHRDLKTDNFAIGYANPHEQRLVYMLDYGLAREYRDKQGQIRMPRMGTHFRGTPRYASINSHEARDLCRKDDIESWMYMTIEFTTGHLPWKCEREKNIILALKKESRTPEGLKDLLMDCPKEYALILSYVDDVRSMAGMQYWEEPDYEFMVKLLQRAMTKHRPVILSDDPYDWESDDCKSGPSHAHPKNASRQLKA